MKGLEVRMNCKGTRVSEAKGLKQKGYGKGGEQTLKEFLRNQKVVLDEEQERTVAEARKQRKASGQAK